MEENYAIIIYKEILSGKRKRFPSGFWKTVDTANYADAREITIYLIENILQWDDEKIKNELDSEVFFKYKLKGMLYALFNDSVFKAINNAYPGRFKQWELICTPRNFWNEKSAKAATIWLFKEKLKWSDAEIKEKASKQVFIENGLYSMMHNIFGNNVSLIISNAFPKI